MQTVVFIEVEHERGSTVALGEAPLEIVPRAGEMVRIAGKEYTVRRVEHTIFLPEKARHVVSVIVTA